jgi:hypothetical protein
MVGRVTPNSSAICWTVCWRLPSSPSSPYICLARLTCRGPSLGLCPPVRPRARAAASPSIVRSDIDPPLDASAGAGGPEGTADDDDGPVRAIPAEGNRRPRDLGGIHGVLCSTWTIMERASRRE